MSRHPGLRAIRRLGRLSWLLTGLLATAAQAQEEPGPAHETAAVDTSSPAPPNGSCIACHNRIEFDPVGFDQSVHGDIACGDCHKQFHGDPHGQGEVAPPQQEWLARVLSVPPYSPTGPWAACADCHDDVVSAMERSRHIVPMLEEGTGDGAFCGDCHGDPHYIAGAPDSPRERFEFIRRSCVRCHADPALIARYNLNPDVVYTYEHSIHGRVARLSPDDAPTCVDCHEAHAVMGPNEPDSPLALERRAAVCSQCHEGANQNFASVIAHSRITREGSPAAYWTTVFFASLTLGVIVLLVLHMIMDAITGVREALRKRP